MDLTNLAEIRGEPVKTKEQIKEAVRLSTYYNQVPIKEKQIVKAINSDWWTCIELLSDLIRPGKCIEAQRENVGFLFIDEVNPRSKPEPKTDLFVECFAADQSYDIEVLANWVNYRLDQAAANLGRIDRMIWYVDELNVPLQKEVAKLGFKGYYDSGRELITFVR